MELKVYGHEKLVVEIAGIEGVLDRSIAEGLAEAAEKIKEDAKGFCPVDTGSLRRSIRTSTVNSQGHLHMVSVSAGGGEVTNPRTGKPVDYAAYVEFGTSKTKPQPFMQPAVDGNREEIVRILYRKVQEAVS